MIIGIVSILFVNIFISILLQSFTVFATTMLCSIIFSCLCMHVSEGINKRKLFLCITVCYIIMITFSIVVYYGYIKEYGFPYATYMNDDMFSDYNAYVIRENNWYTIHDIVTNDPYLSLHNSKLFILILSYFIRFGELFDGFHTMSFRIFNIWIVILTAVISSVIAYRWNLSGKGLIKLILLLCVFPNILFISAHVYRDSMVTLLFVWFIYSIENILQGKEKTINCISIPIIVYCMIYLRKQYILFLVVVTIILLYFRFTMQIKRYKKVFIVLLSIISLTLVVMYRNMILDLYNDYSMSFARDGQTFVNIVNKIPLMPFGLIIRPLFYLITPFSSYTFNIDAYFKSASITLTQFITLGTLGLMTQIPYLFKRMVKFDEVSVIFITMWVSIAVTSMGFRHILPLYPFMFMMIIYEKSHTSYGARIKNLKSMLFAVFIFLVIYTMIYVLM